MMNTLKKELVSNLPKGKVSYPMSFPTRYQYTIFDSALFDVKVIANSIRASNIEMNLNDLEIEFLPA
jgi:hypothetical protein